MGLDKEGTPCPRHAKLGEELDSKEKIKSIDKKIGDERGGKGRGWSHGPNSGGLGC